MDVVHVLVCPGSSAQAERLVRKLARLRARRACIDQAITTLESCLGSPVFERQVLLRCDRLCHRTTHDSRYPRPRIAKSESQT